MILKNLPGTAFVTQPAAKKIRLRRFDRRTDGTRAKKTAIPENAKTAAQNADALFFPTAVCAA